MKTKKTCEIFLEVKFSIFVARHSLYIFYGYDLLEIGLKNNLKAQCVEA